ncbi:MAG: type II toxin-antitoxin system HicA family toxin [Armatimonadetes bacterium]|nr:type II toxin-antitoxin system HicA family toxin [Armatimonadota bacterium]
MGKYEKLLAKVMSGTADNNIAFDDLCWLLERRGFEMRIKGGHYLFKFPSVRTLSLQRKGAGVKGYQVKQTRETLQQIAQSEKTENE